jgi:transmembrane sensor
VSKKEFLQLLDKYLAGNASDEEEKLLLDVYKSMEEKFLWSLPEMATIDQLEDKLIRRFSDSIRQPAPEKNPATGTAETTTWRQRIFTLQPLTRVAAIVLVILGIGAFWMYRTSPAPTPLFAGKNVQDPIVHANETRFTEKITFSDSSFVDLKAGGRIVYDKDFRGALRQVYLEGEAFFQVTADKNKPFIVYTKKVVARVLGTSFIMNSGLNETDASVLVKTGRVAVYKANTFASKNTLPDLDEGIILLPNHVSSLNPDHQLEKKIAIAPEALKPMMEKSFDFDNTPIAQVFATLQDAYGITIFYDKDKMGSCSLSVNMGKEDFYQKLALICRTINASYEVRNGDIYVSGPGCNN